jgi:hypothetical protein
MFGIILGLIFLGVGGFFLKIKKNTKVGALCLIPGVIILGISMIVLGLGGGSGTGGGRSSGGTILKGNDLQGFLDLGLSLRPGVLDGGTTIGLLLYNENRSSEITVDDPRVIDGRVLVTITTVDRKFGFIFLYDKQAEASYLEKIEVIYLDRKETAVIDEFSQKSMLIIMLGPALVGS